jgi:RNA polymerase sigma-70 factor (sigma-E family)
VTRDPDALSETIDHETIAGGPVPSTLNEADFEEFYAKEFRSLTTLARVLSGSSIHAEDLAQEAMLAAYRKWNQVQSLEFPAGWVRRVCANLAMSRVRRARNETKALLRLVPLSSESSLDDIEDLTFWSEVRRLPRRQAQCVALFYLYQCSVHEIAGTLGCSDGTVKTHLSRARASLADRLGEKAEES